MRVRFAEALHIAHRGRPDADYHHAMKRLQSHGLVLGEKYRSHHFVEFVERHCVAALSALTARSMNHFVPSLGIPADLVLLFDGVSIGARQISRYESLLPTACARGPCNIRKYGLIKYLSACGKRPRALTHARSSKIMQVGTQNPPSWSIKSPS